jgi:hypothetical protein
MRRCDVGFELEASELRLFKFMLSLGNNVTRTDEAPCPIGGTLMTKGDGVMTVIKAYLTQTVLDLTNGWYWHADILLMDFSIACLVPQFHICGTKFTPIDGSPMGSPPIETGQVSVHGFAAHRQIRR